MKELINIHTSQIAERNVNADEVYKIGLNIIKSMTGVDIDKFIFKKKDQAVIMKSEYFKTVFTRSCVLQCFNFYTIVIHVIDRYF